MTSNTSGTTQCQKEGTDTLSAGLSMGPLLSPKTSTKHIAREATKETPAASTNPLTTKCHKSGNPHPPIGHLAEQHTAPQQDF